MTLFLALLALTSQEGRRYWEIPIERMATTTRTHVCVTAALVYRRKQRDGDWHLTIAKTVKGVEYKVVVEIIPALPLVVPRVGQVITACGIRRIDEAHRFVEIHPAESIAVLAK